MDTNGKEVDNNDASVKFSLGNGSMPLGVFAVIIIQTIIIVATIVGVYSNYVSKIDQLVEDNSTIKKELQIIKTEFVTKNEASVQFLFIKDQLNRQDAQISDLQSKIYDKR